MSRHNSGSKDVRAQARRINNMMLRGDGGQGVRPQDRGAWQTSTTVGESSNPYFYSNFFERYREYVRWYMTAWEARKIVDIPVDDAFRIPFRFKGITEEDGKILLAEYNRLDIETVMVRAAKQERLLGGCLNYMVIADGDGDSNTTDRKIDWDFIGRMKGECPIRRLNLIDLPMASVGRVDHDPFSENYDQPESYRINGTETSSDRLIIWDGSPLLSNRNMTVLTGFRANPTGFGESTLAPLYEELVRATGTRQGAYHLVNMASVLLISVENLRALKSTKPGEAAVEAIESMARQISMYRAALVDGMGTEFHTKAASFGSVPELVITFLQVLSAASDIPATRFLGQAPGGLNATGEGDLENYYNMIDGYQRRRIKPRLMKVFDVIGMSKFGPSAWKQMRSSLDIVFPPLWNMDGKEEAELAQLFINAYMPLFRDGVMSLGDFQQELGKRGVFMTDVKLREAVEKEIDGQEPPVDPKGRLAELAKAKEGADEEDGGK